MIISYFQGDQWRYRIAWHTPPTAEALEAAVIITNLRHRHEDIAVRFWTSSDSASDIVTAQHPLVLYASVTRGLAPILNASVLVSIQVMTENSTLLSLPPLSLADNGNGDPDLTRGDGVYSRYMTQYPAVGRYTFTITVSDNSGEAVFLIKSENITERCCGSFLEFDTSELTGTGAFSRQFSVPAINLIQVPDRNTEDRMPPSKIGDLKMEVLPESEALLAMWTAPGDDFDMGSVAGYRFLFASSMAELLDHTQEPAVLETLVRTDKTGTQTSHQFKFNYFEEEFYIGLVAHDDFNNTGKISNIVPVLMPALHVESVASTDDKSQIISIGSLQSDWTLIAAVCGSILLLALLLLCGILYFLRFSRRKKPVVTIPSHHGKDDGTDNSSCTSSDSKNTSSHRLMPDITTVAGSLPLFEAPPSSLPDSTPTYWSATQLLTEHEQRALNLSYSAIHGPMETIREEYIGYPEEFNASGISNPAFSRNNNGTPVHGVFPPKDESLRSGVYRVEAEADLLSGGSGASDRHSAASSNPSVISVGSNLFRSMGGGEEEGSDPVRYSTGVQTTAPSTTASLRLSRTRNVSLV